MFNFIFRKIRITRKRVVRKKRTNKEYAALREQARQVVHERLEHFNKHYGFTYQKVFIKDQKSRWGSCSSKGNLNFNYRIATLPPELQDYLIVHELCHLGQMNHSAEFWKLVEQTIPNYRDYDTRLKHMKMRSP